MQGLWVRPLQHAQLGPLTYSPAKSDSLDPELLGFRGLGFRGLGV